MATTKTYKCPSEDFPSRNKFVRFMLSELLDRNEGWIHFDCRTDKGWLEDVFCGRGPFLEIASDGDSGLILVAGKKLPDNIPPVPPTWEYAGWLGMGWSLKPLNIDHLAGWICDTLELWGSAPDHELSAYIEY